MITPENKFLSELFDALNNAKTRYAVMRNYQTLPFSTDGSDLDILVHPADAEQAKEIIFNAIKQSGGVPVGYVDMPGFLKVFALGSYTTEGNKLLWWGLRLDISFGLLFAGTINLLEWRYEQIESHNGVLVLRDSLANILGILKEVLHNNQMPVRYLDSARTAVASEWANMTLALAPMGSKALNLFRALLSDTIAPAAIVERYATIRKALRYHAFSKSPLNYLKGRALFEWSKGRRFITPPGLMIAILGVDGAGKSTVIDAIRPVLDEATHNALFVQHLRPSLLPPLARLKGKKAVQVCPVLDPHGSNPSGVVGSFLRLTYLTLDYILGYWLKIRPKIAKQPAIVLFDRYAYDMAIDPLRFRIGLSGKVVGWFVSLVPKPDLIFCLYANPEIIVARKCEITIDETRRQGLFLNNFAKNESNAVLISTDTSIENSRNKILQSISEFLINKSSTSYKH